MSHRGGRKETGTDTLVESILPEETELLVYSRTRTSVTNRILFRIWFRVFFRGRRILNRWDFTGIHRVTVI